MLFLLFCVLLCHGLVQSIETDDDTLNDLKQVVSKFEAKYEDKITFLTNQVDMVKQENKLLKRENSKLKTDVTDIKNILHKSFASLDKSAMSTTYETLDNATLNGTSAQTRTIHGASSRNRKLFDCVLVFWFLFTKI